jgi:hypothetical protein
MRLLKKSGSWKNRDFKLNKHTVKSRNLKVIPISNRNFYVYLKVDKDTFTLSAQFYKIVEPSGNLLFKKRLYLTKGTLLQVKNLKWGERIYSDIVDVIQISKASSKTVFLKPAKLLDLNNFKSPE